MNLRRGFVPETIIESLRGVRAMSVELLAWLQDHWQPTAIWFAKVLSHNDTLSTGAHQAGPYLPRELLFAAFPQLNRPQDENPDVRFELRLDSHPDIRVVRAVWYNNRLRGRTRNETRVTGLGGVRSALLDPESTGSLCVFAFRGGDDQTPATCHVWICRDAIEADAVENLIGTVEPGRGTIVSPSTLLGRPRPLTPAPCSLTPAEIRRAWPNRFPDPEELIEEAVRRRPDLDLEPDHRLIRRRVCEYEVFRSVEEAVVLPQIQGGFESVAQFTALAQTVLQRRKSRSGRSLELHTRKIFIEEELVEDRDFAYNPESEPGRRPDFLFPSVEAYHNRDFPAANLRMLAVKTTCKDRWRQILEEAERVHPKHLLTLQEGVTEHQFNAMAEAGVQLVVPSPLSSKFPRELQPRLQTLESFIADVRHLALGRG